MSTDDVIVHDRELYDDVLLAKLAVDHGWSAEPTQIYDEEGVDAWVWTSPNGIEFTVIGDTVGDPKIDDDDLIAEIVLHLEAEGVLDQAISSKSPGC
jgi:hypothetical protein